MSRAFGTARRSRHGDVCCRRGAANALAITRRPVKLMLSLFLVLWLLGTVSGYIMGGLIYPAGRGRYCRTGCVIPGRRVR